MQKLLHFLRALPSTLLSLFKKVKSFNYVLLVQEVIFFIKFFILVLIYLGFDLLRMFWHMVKWIPGIKQLGLLIKPNVLFIYTKLVSIFSSRSEGAIASIDLIVLATQHLKAKRNRTIITIVGMSIGFGSVVFLLSLGFGVQRLVISRVARLNELRQIDVTTGQASALRINDSSLEQISKIDGVKGLLPVISVVSKVEYNNSVSDAIVYGVSKEFLQESALKPVKGEIFEDTKNISFNPLIPDRQKVAGAQQEVSVGVKMYKQLSQVEYAIHPLVWKPVYEEPTTKSKILGYTKRDSNTRSATEVWGDVYKADVELPKGADFFGNEFVPWISDSVLLWSKEPCKVDTLDCSEGNYVVKRVGGVQELAAGYLTQQDVTLKRFKIVSEALPIIEEGAVVTDIEFSIPTGKYVPIYSQPEQSAQTVQLFAAQPTSTKLIQGELVYGERYAHKDGWGGVARNSNGQQVGLWIRAKMPLWRQIDCSDCDELYLRELDGLGKQVEAFTYIRASQVSIENMEKPPKLGSVLGDSTEAIDLNGSSTGLSATLSAQQSNQSVAASSVNTLGLSASASAGLDLPAGQIALPDGSAIEAVTREDGSLDWVIISSAEDAGKGGREVVPFAPQAQRVALVNRAFLSVLGIAESEALGKVFETTLRLDNSFFDDEYQVETPLTEITIIGVLPDERTSSFYMPFDDIKSLGVTNYSQLKVIIENEKNMKDIRHSIESMGFRTSSVVDTVNSINSLFNSLRVLLSIVGMVALSIAALGMFNTLTVSLLEKTREVGLMKAIGMRSSEVKRLFLAESIIMGLSGGIFGVVLGTLVGQVLSILVSSLSITQGQGYINLVHVPLILSVGIISLAFIVGILTGLYPSHRATKISALNALRYE
jgi:ABC-type antimicrobial peptide transport system permease subunit